MNTTNNTTTNTTTKTNFTFGGILLLLAKTAILIIIAIKLWFWPLAIVTALVLIVGSIWVGLGKKIEAYKKEMSQLFDQAIQQWNQLDKIKPDPANDIYVDDDELYQERAKGSMPVVRRLHAVKKRRDEYRDSREIRKLSKTHSDTEK